MTRGAETHFVSTFTLITAGFVKNGAATAWISAIVEGRFFIYQTITQVETKSSGNVTF